MTLKEVKKTTASKNLKVKWNRLTKKKEKGGNGNANGKKG